MQQDIELVDEAGWGVIEEQTPATVYLSLIDGEMVATKLVVHPHPNPAREQTATQTTALR